jgi:hypothetical protein
MNARSARWETLAGALAVIAWAVAVAIVEGSGDTGDESAADLLAYFEDQGMQLYLGGMIFFAGSALMIWFGGVLRGVIAAAGLNRLASITQGSAVAVAVTSMGLIAPQMGAGFAADANDAGLTPEAAQALWSAGDGFLIGAAISTASLAAAVGLAILRGRMLPTWLGWLSLVLAVALLIPYVNWAAVIFAAPLWVLLMTWFMWRAEASPVQQPALE